MERLADRYDLGDALGQGRSTVFRAVDTRLRRDVAIKRVQLLAGQEDAEQVRTRALREAQASARLNNPSAVAVYDVVEEAGAIWLVMELVDGPSLAQIVADEGPLPHSRAAVIGMAVLTALEAAHLVGVVHRDVKPANVLVSAGDRAKLTDFGVATIRDESRVTATGLIVGSPSYMAPEQATGGEITPATDLWALGALLYFAVEGDPPFLAGSALATASAVVHGEPRPQQHPGPLSPLLTRLFVKDPARRPTAGQVRATLARVAREARPRPTPAPSSSSDQTLVAGPLPAVSPRSKRRRSAPRVAPDPSPEVSPAGAADVSPAPVAGSGPPVSPAATPPAGSAPVPEVSPVEASEVSEASPGPTAASERLSTAAPVPDTEVSHATPSDPAVNEGVTSDVPVPEAEPAAPSIPDPGGSADASPATAVHSASGAPVPVRRRAPSGPVAGRQRQLVVGVVAVLVVVLVAVVAAALPGGGGDDDPSANASQDDAPAATDASTTTEPVAPTTAAPSPPPTAAGLPAGWTLHTDSLGAYTIGLPPGWHAQPTDSPNRIKLVDPATDSLLLVEWTATPGADAVQAWRDSEGGFAARNAGYQQIGISQAAYRDYPAAMWEFRHGTDPAYHTANLGFITHGRGYALMFRTPEGQWAAGQPTFEQFKQTFQPT
jgi:serine/threonine protein kinase